MTAEREKLVLVRDCGWVWGGGASVSGSEVTGAETELPELSSKMEGSEGDGPSSAHLRVSYLERMKDSILLKRGTIHQFYREDIREQKLRTGQEGRAPLSNEPPNTN